MKIFACSDIHGFYKEFKEALVKSGFEENNPDHLLIVCGDYWDRGYNPYKIVEYLNGINNISVTRTGGRIVGRTKYVFVLVNDVLHFMLVPDVVASCDNIHSAE